MWKAAVSWFLASPPHSKLSVELAYHQYMSMEFAVFKRIPNWIVNILINPKGWNLLLTLKETNKQSRVSFPVVLPFEYKIAKALGKSIWIEKTYKIKYVSKYHFPE